MGKSKAVAKSSYVIQFFIAMTVLVFSSIGAAKPAHAQQTDADFSAYCRANFNNSAYQKFAQTWGTEHACVQSGTRQGIDLAAACLLTTGSRSYEISGARVLCDGNAGDAPVENANDTGEPDFARYCNENFANSTYEKRPEPTGVKHYCRRPGATSGFTLQPIDLAAACRITQGVSQYRIAGARVFCTTASGGGGGNPSSDDGGGGGGGGGPLPDPDGGPANPTPDSPIVSNPANPGEIVACQTLGGEWRSGTMPLIDQIIAKKKFEISRCKDVGLCDQIKVERSIEAYMNTLLIYQCHQNYFLFPEDKSNDDIVLATKEACEIESVLNSLLEQAQNNGAFMPPLHYLQLSPEKMAEICDCEPEDIPDFTARVEELQQQAEQELIAEFSE